MGRFMQTDPIGYEDNMNMYGYTANDPVNNNDPSGKWAWEVVFAAVGAGVEAYNQYSETGAINDWGAVAKAGFDATTVGTAINTAIDVANGDVSITDAVVEAAISKVGGKVIKKVGGCCFVAGTQVLTKYGLKNIEDIKEGDLVWSRNPETGEQKLKPVTDFIPRHERVIWELIVQNAAGETETFETTDEHPWWVDGQGWKRTDELTFGMRVEDEEQNVLVVTSVKNTGHKDGTYNLTVADFHTYFVGNLNVLVHNCNKKGREQVTVNKSTRKEAKNARPRAKPHMKKDERKGQLPTTRQGKNKIGAGNRGESHSESDHSNPHFHDGNHNNKNKPNVHYEYPKNK